MEDLKSLSTSTTRK